MAKKELSSNEQYEVIRIKKRMTIVLSIVTSFTFILGIVLGAVVMHNRYRKFDDPNLQKIAEIYDIMLNDWYYSEEDSADKFRDDMIDALTSQNDPYTFYTATKADQNLSMEQKGYGFITNYYGGNYYVSYVYENADCEKAGLQAGDVIVSSYVDGSWVDLDRVSVEEGLKALRSTGDIITYRILRDNLEISFSKSSYNYRGVQLQNAMIDDQNRLLVSVKIDSFLDKNLAVKMDSILKKCLQDYQKKVIDQLTIDICGNGGGYVQSAIDLSSLFVPKGSTILRYRYKDGHEQLWKTTTNRQYEIPSFNIIQDRNSASASETFALAMKELVNARILGTTSYGKGLVQDVHYFSDGSAMRYTIAETLSPNGVSINKIGLKPDVDYSLAYTYFGEVSSWDEANKQRALAAFNLVLSHDYEDFQEALHDFQIAYGLAVKDYLDIEGAQILQKACFDSYLNMVLKWQQSYVKEI